MTTAQTKRPPSKPWRVEWPSVVNGNPNSEDYSSQRAAYEAVRSITGLRVKATVTTGCRACGACTSTASRSQRKERRDHTTTQPRAGSADVPHAIRRRIVGIHADPLGCIGRGLTAFMLVYVWLRLLGRP